MRFLSAHNFKYGQLSIERVNKVVKPHVRTMTKRIFEAFHVNFTVLKSVRSVECLLFGVSVIVWAAAFTTFT